MPILSMRRPPENQTRIKERSLNISQIMLCVLVFPARLRMPVYAFLALSIGLY